MTDVNQLITEHLDIWTSAIEKKSSAGRGSGGGVSLYGLKKLRDLILELGARGKLVPQFDHEGTGEELLKRILQQRKTLEKNKQVRPKSAGSRSSNHWPFRLPDSWTWATLSQTSDFRPGKTPSTKNSTYWSSEGQGYPWVSISDLVANGSVSSTAKEVSETAHRDVFKGALVPAGTLLMSFKLTIGKTSFLDIDAFHNEAIIGINPLEGVSKDYLFRFLPLLSSFASDKAAIKGNTLNAGSLSLLPVPLPPLAEQDRIVSKVDELMGLCDAMERQTENSLKAHQTLVETCLATLTNSQSPEELTQNWARIEAHFDTLFTTEESVESLVQGLLKLIYSGLLSSGTGKKAEMAKIGTYRKLQNGYAFKSGTFKEDGIRLLRNINIGHDQIDWTETVCLSFEAALEFKRFELNHGDIVLTLDRPFISTGTKVARIRDADLPSLLLQRVGRFVATCEGLDDEYLFLWLNSELFKEQVVPGRSNGVPHISSKQVEGAEIFVPSLEEQRRLVDLLTLMLGDCRSLQTRIGIKNKRSTDLADTLTSKTH